MAPRTDKNAYVLVAVPVEKLEQLQKFCRAIRIVTAPNVIALPASPLPAPDPTDEFQGLSDEEVLEFVHLLFTFALDTYDTGKKRSAAQCILYHVYALAVRRRKEVGRAIVEAAKKHKTVQPLLREFLEGGGVENWEAALGDLVETGNMQRSLGFNNATRKISYAQRDHKNFINAFKTYLANRLDPRKRERFSAVYAALLVAILLPPSAQAAPPAIRGATSSLRLVAIGGLATVLIGGIVYWTIHSARPRDADGKAIVDEGPNLERNESVVNDPKRATSSSQVCLSRKDGFEVKACLIAEADRQRSDYELAKQIYKQAIAYRYDPTGLGDREGVREPFLPVWQDLHAYERLASLDSSHGDHKAALAELRERMKMKSRLRGEQFWMLVTAEECSILMTLTERAEGPGAVAAASSLCAEKIAPYPSSFWNPYRFELGRSHEAAGEWTAAFQDYARELWSDFIQSREQRDEEIARWQKGQWSDLVKRDEIIAQSRRHLQEVSERLRSSNRVVVQRDAIAWTDVSSESNQRLNIVPLGWLTVADNCIAREDEFSPAKHALDAAKTCSIVVTIDSIATNGDATVSPIVPLNIGKIEASKQLAVHLTTKCAQPATTPPGCLNQETELILCLSQDGTLRPGPCG